MQCKVDVEGKHGELHGGLDGDVGQRQGFGPSLWPFVQFQSEKGPLQMNGNPGGQQSAAMSSSKLSPST